jgi:flagellar basal body rod protein FlgG
MLNGLYSGATALDIFSRQQDLIASNLAHLSTPGHKRMLFAFHERTENGGQPGDSRPGTNVAQIATDFSQGRHEPTGRPLDIAISGEGFFTFQGQEGEFYSRNGALFRDTQNQLVNGDGMPILSDGQPITVPPEVSDRDLVIDSAGGVSANGQEFGRISVVTFEDNRQLTSDSQISFQAGNAVPTPAEQSAIVQGSRELSNAHPVTELISLIIGSRHFESAQRAIRTISDAIQENVRA